MGSSGSRTGENRLEALAEAVARKDVYIVGASDDTLEWLLARCVRAEEALRRLREFIKNDCEAARIIDAALSTTPAGCKRVNNHDGLLAAVPEKDKP